MATSAGRLPYRAIVHVAGINMLWRASSRSIEDSIRNALKLAEERGLSSLAFPVIGAGSGGFPAAAAEQVMLETFAGLECGVEVVLVRYRRE